MKGGKDKNEGASGGKERSRADFISPEMNSDQRRRDRSKDDSKAREVKAYALTRDSAHTFKDINQQFAPRLLPEFICLRAQFT